LIVQGGAYLVSTGGSTGFGKAAGAFLKNTDAWTVTVNGGIVSNNDTGIYLEANNAAVSTITIGVDGEVGGEEAGIYADSAATINNSGVISATLAAGYGIRLNDLGKNSITNSGTIAVTGAGGFAIQDKGTGTDTVKNLGTLDGLVDLGNGDDTLSNTGTITIAVDLGPRP